MSEEFDPYLRWLGIRDPQRPPNHYRLLGVELFESDPDVISNAADRQMAHVRTFQSGRRSPESQKLLNELAGAKVCLLNPQKKAAYDAQLQAERTNLVPPPVAPPVAEATVPALPSSTPLPPARRFRIKWVAIAALGAGTAVLVAILAIGLGGGGSFDEDSELADSEGHGITGIDGPSEPRGRGLPDAVRDAKTDPPAKLEPGMQPDAGQAAKAGGPQPVKGDAPKKFKPPPPSIGPKAEKPASKSLPEVTETKPPADQVPPAAQSLAAVRTAMKQRNVTAARRHLVLAEKAASPQEQEQIRRLNDVLTPWEEFWAAVRNGILECREGEILRAGGLSVEVVNRSDGAVTVRGSADAKKGNITYRLRNIPGWLAMTVAEKKLPENAANLPKAAFLLVDPEGDTRQAKQLCEQSARLGVAPSPGLTAELKDALAAAPPPGPSSAPAKPATRFAVPDAATQQAEKKKVRDAFRVAQARNPIDKGVLAADLLREARQSKDAPAARFALLAEARDLALGAGEPVRFREAIDEIVQAYEIDLLEEQTRALVEASEAPLPSPVRITLAKIAIGLAQDALQADSYDAASQLAKAGFSFATKVMATKGRDPQMIREASDLSEAIPWYKEQHDLALQAEKALAQDPANAKAAQFLGKYYALVKEQWDRGLPLLLKGADAPLKALAEAEQAARRSATAEEMVKLADQWVEAAPSLEASHERSARHRALYWYEAALPYVGGPSRERVVRAIDTLKQSETPRRK